MPGAANKRVPAHTIFLHIPKAGGSTLHAIFDRYYRPWEIHHVGGGRTLETLRQFESLSQRQRDEISLLRGHVRFGVHEMFTEPSRYVTFLRDPVDRILSFYKYAKRSPTNHIHLDIVRHGMTLADVMAEGLTTELNNGQVRRLAGYDRFNEEYGFNQCPEDLLDVAFGNIQRHFSLVGFIENFDESLLLLAGILGWSYPPYYSMKNVSKGNTPGAELDAKTLNLICDSNKLDLELYRIMKQRFLEHCANQDGFQERVAQFRRWNGRLTQWVKIENLARRGILRILR